MRMNMWPASLVVLRPLLKSRIPSDDRDQQSFNVNGLLCFGAILVDCGGSIWPGQAIARGPRYR